MKHRAFSVDGSVAVVTGGVRGIGLAIAQRLYALGARVVIADLRESEAKEVAGRLGARALGIELDVTDRSAWEVAVDRIQAELGPIDIVVNNAGIMPVGPLLDEKPGVAEATLAVNFWAHYHSFQIVAPKMIARGRGHFINLTSAAGAIHSPGLSTYVASKHAATGFARSAREELIGTGVTISVVMPSAVKTDLVAGIPFKRWERLGIVSPASVARRAVGTLDSRPAVVGAPAGLMIALRTYHFVPESVWLLGRRIFGADRTLQPIDREARSDYDSRIEIQAAIRGEQ